MGKVKKKVPNRKPKTAFKERNYKKPNSFLLGGPGRNLKIETPELLYDYFKDFKKWCEVNTIKKVIGVSEGAPVIANIRRPFVFKGFEGYLSSIDVVFDLSNYERNDIFHPIIKRIKQECAQDTITGAMVGIYNANLTARLEGLSEKQELDVTDNRKQVGDVFPFSKTEE